MSRSVMSMTATESSLRAVLAAGTREADRIWEKTLHSEAASHLREGRWKEAIQADNADQIRDVLTKKEDLETWIKNQDMERQSEVLRVGVSCLQLFVQVNWVGGDAVEAEDGESLSSEDEEWLVRDGESLAEVVKAKHLLHLARRILTAESHHVAKSWLFNWWRLRSCLVLQQVLTETSEQCHSEGVAAIGAVTDSGEWKTLPAAFRVLWLLEAAQFHGIYYEAEKVRACTEAASEAAGFSVTETGAMGKRTKFQQMDLPQFTLDVQTDGVDDNMQDAEVVQLPPDLKLDDEVRLDKIKFSENRPAPGAHITRLSQCLLLAIYTLKQRSQPKDALTSEEMLPYLDAILGAEKSTWAARVSALLQRSKLESRDKRTVERAMMQVQSLVDHTASGEAFSARRMEMVYASKLAPSWEVERELCGLFQSMGSIKSALDIALRLRLWEDVIGCYHQLQLRHKAAEVIKEQLAKKETPLLLCMLGDATDELSHYERALELTDGRSARAHRSLGLHHYFRKDYAAAVDCLKKSLSLNSFQMQTLLRLGYSAMQVEQWEVAADAYRKYCAYESDNFEAWNNLSNAYIKLGQKSRAWKVLQEAVKCDYDNWKIWDNIMVVSTDCAHFEEVFRAYHRILDLQEKHVDTEVLDIVVKAVTSGGAVKDHEGLDCARHMAAALKLFGRLTSLMPSEGKIWMLYSALTSYQAEQVPESEEPSKRAELHVRACQQLQRAFASLAQKPGWERDETRSREVLDTGIKYANSALNTSASPESKTQSLQLLSSAKMSLRGAVVKVKQGQTAVQTGEIVEGLKETLAELETAIQDVVDRAAELRAE